MTGHRGGQLVSLLAFNLQFSVQLWLKRTPG